MKEFTVVVLLPDSCWVCGMREATMVCVVEAPNVVAAETLAQRQSAEGSDIACSQDVIVLAAFEGAHKDISEG